VVCAEVLFGCGFAALGARLASRLHCLPNAFGRSCGKFERSFVEGAHIHRPWKKGFLGSVADGESWENWLPGPPYL